MKEGRGRQAAARPSSGGTRGYRLRNRIRIRRGGSGCLEPTLGAQQGLRGASPASPSLLCPRNRFGSALLACKPPAPLPPPRSLAVGRSSGRAREPRIPTHTQGAPPPRPLPACLPAAATPPPYLVAAATASPAEKPEAAFLRAAPRRASLLQQQQRREQLARSLQQRQQARLVVHQSRNQAPKDGKGCCCWWCGGKYPTRGAFPRRLQLRSCSVEGRQAAPPRRWLEGRRGPSRSLSLGLSVCV